KRCRGLRRRTSKAAPITSTRCVLPQGDELSASSQVVCGGAAQLSRFAVAAGGVRDLLSLRTERRVDRSDAGALDADERCAHLHGTGAVRNGVQRRQRNVSEIFQALRDREISDALLHARPVEAW